MYMPKATLLKDQYASYTMIHGTGSYHFKGGVPKEVPPVVALELQKKTQPGLKGRKKKLFRITDMPNVVSNVQHPPADPEVDALVVQNVAGNEPKQLRFESWL
jgi:hypothetical protein